jgi:hypothetical protein
MSTEYSVRVVVYNCCREVLEEIRRAFGGTLSYNASRNPKWKPSLALIWTNAAAVGLLETVSPFLRIKSRHAEVLLRFAGHIRKCRRARDGRGRLLPLSDRELRVRERFHERLRRLNARGSASIVLRGRQGRDRRPRISTVLSPEYLAGFIDGEGSLMISRWADSMNLPRYGSRIAVSNTDRLVLEEIQQIFGGLVFNQPRARIGWKDAHALIWTGPRARKLLPIVAPYLRVKRKQAAVMRQFMSCERKQRQNGIRRCLKPLPREVIAELEEMRRRIKSLNAKGPTGVMRVRT